MEAIDGNAGPVPDPVFRIILHVSPSIDADVTHWTEAPECPVANEDGSSPDEAIDRTQAIIKEWWTRRTGEPVDGLQFVLVQGN
ncbi:hypothetical protein [Nocardioides sp. LHG3406-4]|uniref:hypothetical protein n=1 Tax=Nocardioides sp. LHG3406-4 TaxID=2804575 RepID=UPI003CF1483D